MPKPTRAEVLAEYLGLSEKTHPECFRCDSMIVSGARKVKMWEQVVRCSLPDPLAPGTAADAWGPPIDRFFVQHRNGSVVVFSRGMFGVRVSAGGDCVFDESPTIARVRAMMAADPAFKEKMAGATP